MSRNIHPGPISNKFVHMCFHGLFVVWGPMVDGKVILDCKSSYRKGVHKNGYIKVSPFVMLLSSYCNEGYVICLRKGDHKSSGIKLLFIIFSYIYIYICIFSLNQTIFYIFFSVLLLKLVDETLTCLKNNCFLIITK